MGGQGYTAAGDQIEQHAGNIDALRERFAAVKSASAHIAQDDEAYGLLCGWISGILEDKHLRQDELIAYVEENLKLVGDSLRSAAKKYDEMENEAVSSFGQIGGELR